jgi:hypothetical protein
LIGCRHGLEHPFGFPAEDALAALATMVDRLAARDLDGLADAVRAARVLELRPLLDRLEGQWLKELGVRAGEVVE